MPGGVRKEDGRFSRWGPASRPAARTGAPHLILPTPGVSVSSVHEARGGPRFPPRPSPCSVLSRPGGPLAAGSLSENSTRSPDASVPEAEADGGTLAAVPARTQSMTRIPIPGEGGLSFFGIRDRNLRSLEQDLGLTLASRGDVLLADGPEDRIALLGTALEGLAGLRRDLGQRYRIGDLRAAIRILSQDPGASLREYFVETVVTPSPGKLVRPRSLRQLEYIRALRAKELVLGVGPAGTGKTWLAMAVAVEALRNQQVRRIVLTRPAVEAGEKLGFLPGDLIDKVDPYLRPLYDALHDMMDAEKAQRLRERGVIEIAPIAFMRGRTLNDAFIILDEAQNTTSEQMKMFLTRMGNGTRAVVTGDITQNDLPPGRVSGLVESLGVIGELQGVGLVRLEESDGRAPPARPGDRPRVRQERAGPERVPPPPGVRSAGGLRGATLGPEDEGTLREFLVAHVRAPAAGPPVRAHAHRDRPSRGRPRDAHLAGARAQNSALRGRRDRTPDGPRDRGLHLRGRRHHRGAPARGGRAGAGGLRLSIPRRGTRSAPGSPAGSTSDGRPSSRTSWGNPISPRPSPACSASR